MVGTEIVVVINLAVEDNSAVVVGLVKNFLVEPITLPTVGKFFGVSFDGFNVVFIVVYFVFLVRLDMFEPSLGLGCDVTICYC